MKKLTIFKEITNLTEVILLNVTNESQTLFYFIHALQNYLEKIKSQNRP